MPLKTTVIGAYPKPEYLPIGDWFGKGQGVAADAPYPAQYNGSSDVVVKAMKDVIKDQEHLGIDVITDGEVKRYNYVYHFCRNQTGFDFDKSVVNPIRNGACSIRMPTITKKIEPETPWIAEEWKQSQSFTGLPMKMTIPGPMTVIDSTYNVFYDSKDVLYADLVKAINTQVLGLMAAGCKHIQIDEPSLVRKPDEALQYGIGLLEGCFQGVGSEVQKIVHICCGYPQYLDEENYAKADRDCYLQIADRLDSAAFDAISIEDAHRQNDLELFSRFKKKTVVLGVVAIAKSRVETVEEIAERARQVLNIIPSQRLVLAPDCGLGFLPPAVMKLKLQNMVTAAKSLP